MISPLAPPVFPTLLPIAGVRWASVAAGVRYADRADVMLAELVEGSTVAGVFTRSATRSAAVRDCQAKLGPQTGRAAVLVNSGNANAFTGAAGQTSVDALCAELSSRLSVDSARIFTASTGVIGEPLPHERIVAALDDAIGTLSPDGAEGAARAIMTTDTFPKGASTEVMINGHPVRITGIAKGSGMIAPDMATMLVYIFTDARLAHEPAQALLSQINERSFNCITVDGDTSTSDTLIFGATGASGVDVKDAPEFAQALERIMMDLAHQVVRDGEGASKFVTVAVSGAADELDARKVASSIANSPLVKTAVAGEDPNWGRIVMAVGKSGAQADRDLLRITFGDILVAENGWVAKGYREEDGAAYMKQTEIEISVDLGLGDGKCTMWTCDLTNRYIQINADYRS